MIVYAIILVEYDTYSYKGVTESERKLFKSEESAKAWADSKGLKIVFTAEKPGKECELEPMPVLD